MDTVVSQDGTRIAFDRLGQGPALILVMGALNTRADSAALAQKLAQHFTVFNYDRRGRGDSGDKPPYAIAREVEDLAAVVGAAGGAAFVFGHSSGAVLALEAAGRLAAASQPGSITRLAVYEPPFLVDDSRPPLPGDYVARFDQFNASHEPGQALEYFFTTGLQMPPEAVQGMRHNPSWAGLEKVAPTLAYDAALTAPYLRGQPFPTGWWAAVNMPVLVMDGGDSPAMLRNAADALAASLPNAQHHRFPGQGHGVADDLLVPVLVDFLLQPEALLPPARDGQGAGG